MFYINGITICPRADNLLFRLAFGALIPRLRYDGASL